MNFYIVSNSIAVDYFGSPAVYTKKDHFMAAEAEITLGMPDITLH
jgi:hypothetical protein